VTANHHKSPVDLRPFQARAVLERQQALEAQYGNIAIDEIVAALHHLKAAPTDSRQPTAKAA
jgi:hypothetical protein